MPLYPIIESALCNTMLIGRSYENAINRIKKLIDIVFSSIKTDSGHMKSIFL